jgi:hypothetical protein
VDQSSGEGRKISDLDVRRRASARAVRVSEGDHTARTGTRDEDRRARKGH